MINWISSRGCASLFVSAAAAALLLGRASAVRADYARPPQPSPYLPSDRASPDPTDFAVPPDAARERRDRDAGEDESVLAHSHGSSARFQIGPALLLESTSPGFYAAFDFGRRSVGARLAGAWLRTESDQGLSAYSAELWIDFRQRYDLHPILGAGASWLHGSALGENSNAGAGVLRGALEYDLPISDADARVGASGTLLVPTIASERTRPWVTLGLGIGVGF